MGKIVGNIRIIHIFFWLMYFFASSIHLPSFCQISMRLLSAQEDSLKKAIVGQPFVIEITLRDISSTNDIPQIKGLDAFYVRHYSKNIMIINGKTTIQHRYRVRIDTVGTFTVGPALCVVDGKTIRSFPMTVSVVDEPSSNKVVQTNETTGAFLKFSVDKDKVVVGEKIQCCLQFYYSPDVLKFNPITLQQVLDFANPINPQAENKVQEINGNQYHVAQVTWETCALQPGKKIIPAHSVDYLVAQKSNNYFGNLGMILNHFGQPKRVYSNALTLKVEALPPHSGPVHAIGRYSSFAATLEPVVAKVGEGMIFKLEIIGKGNLDDKNSILTIHLPKTFKYYDSKSYIEQQKDGNSKHYFEFVLQGSEKGNWEIPRQTFTFFDTKNQAYKTLYSLPIQLTLLPSQQSVQKQQSTNAFAQNAIQNNIDPNDEIAQLNVRGMFHTTTGYMIPWWLLFIVIILPMIYMIIEYIKKQRVAPLNNRSKYAQAFKNARTSLAIKDLDHKKVYKVFVTLFADRLKVPEQQVTQEYILKKINELGLKQEDCDAWQQFYATLHEYVFFDKKGTHIDSNALRSYAMHWLDRLEKIL